MGKFPKKPREKRTSCKVGIGENFIRIWGQEIIRSGFYRGSKLEGVMLSIIEEAKEVSI